MQSIGGLSSHVGGLNCLRVKLQGTENEVGHTGMLSSALVLPAEADHEPTEQQPRVQLPVHRDLLSSLLDLFQSSQGFSRCKLKHKKLQLLKV